MSTGKWKRRRLTERSFRGRFCADVGDRLLYISFSNTLAIVLRRSGLKMIYTAACLHLHGRLSGNCILCRGGTEVRLFTNGKV